MYESIGQLKKLYKNLYNLEIAKERGNVEALVTHIDLTQSLLPDKRIITLRQRFCISHVLINNNTLEDASKLLNVSINTIQIHINNGLRHILESLNDGSIYDNKYEYIKKNLNIKKQKQIAEDLGLNENTVKSIIRRMKKGGYLG